MDKVTKMLSIAVIAIAVIDVLALWLTEGFHSGKDIIDSLLLAVSLP